jgi:hypothetical protein
MGDFGREEFQGDDEADVFGFVHDMTMSSKTT